MTPAEFLLNQHAWCNKMLDTPAAELPGTLTHDKVGKLLDDIEDQLLDHARYTLDGKVVYASAEY